MEQLIKRLMTGRPHIRFFNGTWRASQVLMMTSNGDSACTMEVFGGSPVEAGLELQKAMLYASQLKLGKGY
jgi:hypothetical protein